MHRRERKQLLVGAASLCGLAIVVHLLDGWFHTNPLAASLIGAVIVDLFGGRLGLQWNQGLPANAWQRTLRVLRGVALGAGIALFIVLVAAMLGWTHVMRGSPTVMGLGLGVAGPLAMAARDELLYRGVPMAIAGGRVPDRYLLPFVALLGAAPIVLQPGASVIGVVLAISSGAFFAVCWRLGRGAYVPWGAHAGWLFMAGAGVHGGLLDAWFRDGVLVPISRAHGTIAWLAAVVFAIAALGSAQYVARRRARETLRGTSASGDQG